VRGQHHRLFVEPAYGQSAEYRDFWKKLNAGEHVSASFRRFGKGGKEVWIQASYNPILDADKRVTKIVKFASDITDLTEIGSGLARLADNNLEHKIEKSFSPTFEKLRLDFNVAHETLRNALFKISESSEAIRLGTEEISGASNDLARRTEQQAASLEQTAAALDEITATVKKSAEGAGHAREIVVGADDDAKKSAVVVRQAVEAMDAISKSAQQISQIIGVIDEIAFQTNLLALNAGVEAARAGEAGRGFAVVASEVRALAQRSAEAAKEIKTLISASSAQVDHGVRLVAEAGGSLDRIMTQVGQINGVVTEIAAGAREQSTGLAEINTAINQMDQATQQNAAMVEETSAASLSLSNETEELSKLVGQFQVGRPNADNRMRAELRKAAPHAFGQAA
jgi:methyl-accepting chemotaxis protein